MLAPIWDKITNSVSSVLLSFVFKEQERKGEKRQLKLSQNQDFQSSAHSTSDSKGMETNQHAKGMALKPNKGPTGRGIPFWGNRKFKEGGTLKVAPDVKSRRSPPTPSTHVSKHHGCQRPSSRSNAAKQGGATHKPGTKPKHVVFNLLLRKCPNNARSQHSSSPNTSHYIFSQTPQDLAPFRPGPAPVFCFCVVDQRMFGWALFTPLASRVFI